MFSAAVMTFVFIFMLIIFIISNLLKVLEYLFWVALILILIISYIYCLFVFTKVTILCSLVVFMIAMYLSILIEFLNGHGKSRYDLMKSALQITFFGFIIWFFIR